jgi:hypothetical protein
MTRDQITGMLTDGDSASSTWKHLGVQQKKRSAARTIREALEVIKLLSKNGDFWEGAEGGTRHGMFAGVRPCPFCAGNTSVLFVECSVLSLMFVGVAVWVAVQRFLVQQRLMLLGKEKYS